MSWEAGPPLVELKLNAASWIFSGLLTLAAGVGVAGCTIAAATHPSNAPGALVAAALLGVATVGLGMLTGWCLMRRVRLYEWGFTARGLLSESQMRFDEVEQIVLPSVAQIGVDPIARATFRGPAKVSLGGFNAARALEVATFALERVVPRLADTVEQRLRGGEEVRFGNARLTASGLSGGGAPIPWSEIDRANFSPEGLRVFPRHRPENTLILPQGTPNLHVIVEIAARMLERGEHIPSLATSPDSAMAASSGGPARLRGFPQIEPELGVLLCGKPRAGVSIAILGAIAVVLGLATLAPLPTEGRIALGVGGAISALLAFGMTRAGYAVYEQGVKTVGKRLLYTDVEHLTYHVVDQYQNGVYSGRSVQLVLEGGGTKIALSGMGAKTEGIAVQALDRAMPPLLERLWRDVQSGFEVKADKLVLKKGTLRWKRDEIPVAQVTGFEPRQGFLHIWKEGQEMSWAIVNLGVRDARLIQPLLARLLEEQAGHIPSRRDA